MTPEEKLLEIKNTLRIHNELAQSQCQWLIDRAERLRDAVKTINLVQNKISALTTGSGYVSDTVREAWNINAGFLCENPDLQNEYLANRSKAVESDE